MARMSTEEMVESRKERMMRAERRGGVFYGIRLDDIIEVIEYDREMREEQTLAVACAAAHRYMVSRGIDEVYCAEVVTFIRGDVNAFRANERLQEENSPASISPTP